MYATVMCLLLSDVLVSVRCMSLSTVSNICYCQVNVTVLCMVLACECYCHLYVTARFILLSCIFNCRCMLLSTVSVYV